MRGFCGGFRGVSGYENVFIHFDGALILHDENARQEIEKGCIPEKRYPYTKLFRLDCNIEKEIAKKMMNVYLPIEELNDEFGLKLTNLTNQRS